MQILILILILIYVTKKCKKPVEGMARMSQKIGSGMVSKFSKPRPLSVELFPSVHKYDPKL